MKTNTIRRTGLIVLILLLTVFSAFNLHREIQAEEIVDATITAQQIDDVMDELFPDKNLQHVILEQAYPVKGRVDIYQRIIDDYEVADIDKENVDINTYIKEALLGKEKVPTTAIRAGLINDIGLEIPFNSGIQSLEGIQNLNITYEVRVFDSKLDDKLLPIADMPSITIIHLDYNVDDLYYNNEYYGKLGRHDELLNKIMEVIEERSNNPELYSYPNDFSIVVSDDPGLRVQGETPNNGENETEFSISKTNYTYFELDYSEYVTLPWTFKNIMYEDTYYIDENGNEAKRDYYESMNNKEYYPMFFDNYEYSRDTKTWEGIVIPLTNNYELHYSFQQISTTKVAFTLNKIVKVESSTEAARNNFTQANAETINEIAIEEFDYNTLFDNSTNQESFENVMGDFGLIKQFHTEYFAEINAEESIYESFRVYWDYGYGFSYPFEISFKLETAAVTPEEPTDEGNAEYKVEHYHQLATGDYELIETETLTGIAGTVAEATVKTYDGYTHDRSIGGTVVSGLIAEDNSLVLKLYYNLNKRDVVDTGVNSSLLTYLILMGASVVYLVSNKKYIKKTNN